jgi:Retrotransposon gag protein/Zinc knuckle
MDDDIDLTTEQRVAKIEAREVERDQTLKSILAILTRNPPPIPDPIPRQTPSQIDIPKASRTARPANPPEFNGERTEGLAFLNSCQTYLRLCPEEFPDEQTKIMWAMSYMKTGRAQKWTARIFRWEQMKENANQSKFLDWAEFRDEFRKEFTPSHADALAINRLESTAYYQRTRSLDDYIDEFQDLIVDSGYTDPKTTVVKFRKGLNTHIQNVVATMAAGRPSDESPEQWYNMARTVDQNRAANEAFSSSHRAPVQTPRLTTSVFRQTVPTSRTGVSGHAHIQPTPGNPVPMDLDHSRKSATPPLCFRCKKPGHFGKDCPDRFDIREMSIEELEEALQLRMTQLDIVPAEPEDFATDNE